MNIQTTFKQLCRKFSFTLTLIFHYSLNYGQQWTQLSDFPSDGRDDGTAFVIGNKAWCGTGVTASFELRRDFYTFNLQTQVWETSASMPNGQERQYAVGFSHNNLGYVFGGINQTDFLNDLWQYDPVSNDWTSKSSLPGAGRSGASGFIFNQQVYIVGGKNSETEALNEVWAYDFTSETWTQKANLPFGGRWRASTVSINGSAFLLFGRDETGRFCNEIYQYDPNADEWTFIGLFPGAGRNYVDTKVMNDKIICFGGNDSLDTFHNDLWRYDPLLNTWTQLNALPAVGRRGSMSFTDGQTYYFSSGLNAALQRINETWKADYVIGLDEITHQDQIKIYPNPASEFTTVDINNSSSAMLKIYNQLGRLCHTENLTKSSNKVSLSNLLPGIYFVSIDDGIFQKLVISIDN